MPDFDIDLSTDKPKQITLNGTNGGRPWELRINGMDLLITVRCSGGDGRRPGEEVVEPFSDPRRPGPEQVRPHNLL